MSLLRELEETLTQHVSTINARVVVERSRRVLRTPVLLNGEDRARFMAAVRSSLRLFTSDEKAAFILADLDRRLSPGASRTDHERLSFSIQSEDDLRAARAAARDLCLTFSSTSTDAHRMATAVSELARNIVNYTPGGTIELELRRGPPMRFLILAEDHGPGIPHLEQVLAGQYRSKTGLGRGLLGVKRLMQQFRVKTGAKGTRIEAEAILS